MDYDYLISSPTEYIYLLKNEYVARILPVLSALLFNDDRSINKIIYIANRELRKLELNINAGKTKKITKDELIDFYLHFKKRRTYGRM